MKRNRTQRAPPDRGRVSLLSRVRWPLVAALAMLIAGAVWFRPPRRNDPEPGLPLELQPQRLPLPRLAPSPFLNTRADAGYVGTDRCTQCHADQHATYLMTAHSRSMSRVKAEREPPDAAFDHAASGRCYRVYRQDDELHH